MGPLDQLARFGPVPSGADRDEAFSWAFGQETYRDGGIERGAVDQVVTAMTWHQITQTRNSWDDDPLVLSRMASSLAAGLWHLGGVVGLRATGGRRGLRLQIGTLATHAAAPLATVRANLPGAAVEPVAPTRPNWRAWGGLRAVLDPDADGGAPALLDRLTALVATDWHLEALLVPVAADEIGRQAITLAHLASRLAGERSVQVQVDPVKTASVDDPVVARLLDAVAKEQQRVEVARRTGAFGVVASLSSPDGAQLASAVGAATGAAPSASVGWAFVAPTAGNDVLPSTVVASSESIDLLRVPLRDVYGLPRRQWHRLDEHPEPATAGGATIRLGQTEQGAPVELAVQLLTHHMLVTGASGSGKSTFVAQALARLSALGVPLWIIEPVKNEWHSLGVPGLRRWAIGAPDPGLPWGLNPLEVPDGVPVATHVDLLVALFRTAFGLPDPLPHLVELGLHATYEAIGWDLGSDRSLRGDDRSSIEWPTISDLLEVCMLLPADLGYEESIQANLRAALLARMGGLARGPRGRLLDTTAVFPIEEALDGTLVINLDGIGDDHARSFVMGLVLIRLVEHRRVHPRSSLAHVTVIEEAHRLMGETTGPAMPGGADPVGATSAMFGNLQGEIRATGEGLIVIDQSPKALVRATLVNTGTQVALRSKDRDDQQSLGAAIGLAAEQDRVLSGLAVHEGLVAWEGMDVPVRAQLDAVRLHSVAPQAGTRVRARLADTAGPIGQAADVFVRAGVQDHGRARGALLDAIEAAHPGIASATKADVLADVVGRHVRAIARQRAWSRVQREAATRAALGGRFEGEHPSQLLVDGRRPHLSCAVICPLGGCRVGDLVEPEARRLLAEGPGTVLRLVASPSEARHRLRRRAMAAVPATAPQDLQDLALGCMAVQVFDEWADPEFVARLVAEVRGPVGGSRG
jgi:hypothetical protein